MDALTPLTGTEMVEQPWLHEFEIAVDGPSTVLSRADGSIGHGATGWYVDDRRVLSVLEVTLDGKVPVAVACSTMGSTSEFWAAARHLGADTTDPTVEVRWRRTLDGLVLCERITVVSRSEDPVETVLEVRVAGDGADIAWTKGGLSPAVPLPVVSDEDGLHWHDERHHVDVTADPRPDIVDEHGITHGTTWRWRLTIEPRQAETVDLTFRVRRVEPTLFDADAGAGACDWDPQALADRIEDPVLAELVHVSLEDLKHLTLRDPLSPDDIIAAAGSPWYLTMFGRDSIWSARMMLPLSRRLALGTLRALARRQATDTDPAAASEPGKILHEVRRTTYESGDMRLPPLYYGTVDATPLWIVLLAETARADVPEAEIRDLLPNLQRALRWLHDNVERSPDGLLRYLDESGTGLANQGWKDSHDSMRRSDGTVAPAPIALLEAQAYAVQAAREGAALLDRFGLPGGADWRSWADDLAGRVRERYWVGDGEDRYLAMALDADGKPVDGVGSNMGHALGTGLLTPEEARLVVRRLMRPDLLRDFGIATLSRDNPAYNPVGYHTGSVWTHDTAIAMLGMAKEGFHDEAREVARRLLRLATATRYRFPELCGGEPVGNAPVPYPASCRPQGWAAASAAALLTVLGQLDD